MIYDSIVEDKAKFLYDQANVVSKYYNSRSFENLSNYDDISPELNSIASLSDATLWVINSTGSICFDSDRTHSDGTVIPNFDPSYFGSEFYSIGNFYDMVKDHTLSVIAPITRNFSTDGYIIMHLSPNVLNEISNSYLYIVYTAYVILMVLSLIILIVFTFAVYLPLKKIIAASKAYSKGLLDYGNIKVNSHDEVGQLAKNLEYMAAQLNSLEEYQHKFVANISHDFRSPLTSIKGYVEAILDGTIPVDIQEKYLTIVLNETERLNKLTSHLLTINAWDNKGRKLILSDFDINQTIKNTLTTFEVICNKRKINFDLILNSKAYIVSADISKIQQVLYNLIDNALKFSPNNSTIRIIVHDRFEKVFVSIKDSGIGIPPASINKIWDRFYKSDLSRGKDKTGSGLGLSITKEIIQSHKENIDVISTEGVGTEFIFTLTKAKQRS